MGKYYHIKQQSNIVILCKGFFAYSYRYKKPPYIVGWFFVLIKYYYLVCVIISVVMVVANEANEIHTEGVLKVLPTAFDSRLRLSLGAT